MANDTVTVDRMALATIIDEARGNLPLVEKPHHDELQEAIETLEAELNDD